MVYFFLLWDELILRGFFFCFFCSFFCRFVFPLGILYSAAVVHLPLLTLDGFHWFWSRFIHGLGVLSSCRCTLPEIFLSCSCYILYIKALVLPHMILCFSITCFWVSFFTSGDFFLSLSAKWLEKWNIVFSNGIILFVRIFQFSG